MMRRILKKIFSLWTLGIILGLVLVLLGSTRFIMKPKAVTEFKKEFENNKYAPESSYIMYNDRKIHYVNSGPDTLPLVLLIHGSPGSWDAMKGFIADTSISNHVRLVSVDRLGFGFTGGKGEEELKIQAESIAGILKTNKSGKKALIVSHSYGGPVSAQLAMDFKENIHSLILAAPAISPEHQPRKWYNYAASFFLFKWVMSPAFQASNTEMWPLKEQLQIQEKRWKEIDDMPITIIHGKKDMLVPFETVGFLADKMKNNRQYKEVINDEMNHFVPWSHPELIAKEIKRHLRLMD